MLQTRFYQTSLYSVDPGEIFLEKESFEFGIRRLLPTLVSMEDFGGFHADTMGAPACCPLVLVVMLMLQFRYNLSDAELIRRRRRDLGFRYALDLQRFEQSPGVTSLRRFRKWIRENKGDDWLFRRSLTRAKELGLIPDYALQTVDSTNTDCRGAVIDSYNLVATAISRVVRLVARCIGKYPSKLAEEWTLNRYLVRSIKGNLDINWSRESERNALITQEIRDADRLAQLVGDLGIKFPQDLCDTLTLMAKVSRQDVEELPDGTFKIAQGTAAERVTSITDPMARHGRKSSSKVFTGFKMHVEGTIDSQFVTGVVMTPGNIPDAKPTKDLISQAASVGLTPTELIGDCAYGTGENRRACNEVGVEVRTKLPSSGRKCFTKRDFDIDLEKMQVTCPNGATVGDPKFVKDPGGSNEPVAKFRFPSETCRSCPLRDVCSTKTENGGGREITLSRYEKEIQDSQAYNANPESKPILKMRSAVERLISHLVRMGMRQARFFGMHMVQFQASLTTAAYNIQRIITLTAS